LALVEIAKKGYSTNINKKPFQIGKGFNCILKYLKVLEIKYF
jgi:hypothetical protein